MKIQIRSAARLSLFLVLVVSLLGVHEVGDQYNAAHGSPLIQGSSAKLPQNAVYDVKITGRTFIGNTNVPTEQTSYSPVQNFTLRGKLVVLPTRDTSGANFKNGVNPRDIGLFVGSPAANPQAGAIWFATNTKVFSDVGKGSRSQSAALDVAFVNLNSQAGAINIKVDSNAARTSQLNTFNVQSGLTANVYQIVAGNMTINFKGGGESISGALDLIGSGFIYSGSTRIQATVTGSLQN